MPSDDSSYTNTSSPHNAAVITQLANGIPLLAEPMPGYHTASLILRVSGGMSSEPAELLGLAGVIEEAIDKGTQRFSARELADAYDAVGASHSAHVGAQRWVFNVSSLPEFMPQTIDLLGEMVTGAVFPDDAVQTAVTLAHQQLLGLEDSPRGLLRRQMALQAYGDVLGRHRLGCAETLERITPETVRKHWASMLRTGAISIAVAGNFDLGAIRERLDAALADLPQGDAVGQVVPHRFSSARSHLTKQLDQTQLGISFPGVRYDDADFAVEKVLLAILSGGMSARLFTEIRERRGLVYWVGAWHEQPVGLGMIHIGAATTTQRCAQTYEALLGEVSRLGLDLSQDELQRAKIGLVAERLTSGASPRNHATDLLTDYMHLGRIVVAAEKERAIRAVTIDDVRRYIDQHPCDALSVVTVGATQPDLPERGAA